MERGSLGTKALKAGLRKVPSTTRLCGNFGQVIGFEIKYVQTSGTFMQISPCQVSHVSSLNQYKQGLLIYFYFNSTFVSELEF